MTKVLSILILSALISLSNPLDLQASESLSSQIIILNPTHKPLRETPGSKEWDCKSTIQQSLIEGAFEYLSEISKQNNIALPRKDLCYYTVGQVLSIPVRYINFFTSENDLNSCKNNDRCFQWRMLHFHFTSSNLYLDFSIMDATRDFNFNSCISIDGRLISRNQACGVALKN